MGEATGSPTFSIASIMHEWHTRVWTPLGIAVTVRGRWVQSLIWENPMYVNVLTLCWLCASLALSAAVAAPLPPHVAAQLLYPPVGLDMTAFDPSTRPGDDFFQYANGAWLARTTIPADKPFTTEAQGIRDRTEAQLRTLIEDAAAKAGHEPASIEAKVGAFYKAYMDAPQIESLGRTPIDAELAAIRKSRSRAELAALMGQSVRSFEGSFFQVGIDVDIKDPEHYAVYLQQGGLTMPDRNYYLSPTFAKEKREFGSYVEHLLALDHWPSTTARAAAIVALETRIAAASWTKAERRDLQKIYNPATLKELEALAPSMPWPALLNGAGLERKTRVIVAEKTAFPKIANIYADTPLETLKAWLAFTVTDSAAPYLSDAFAAAHFKFHDQVLSGLKDQPARWKRGVKAVAGGDCLTPSNCFGTLNWAVGELYTAHYFPPETKNSIEALVANVVAAYRHRIERLDWMSEATRTEALRKLDTYVVKVGYPVHPRDYSGVIVLDDDLVGNVRRAAAADWAFYRDRSDGPVDKSDWAMTPQTVDAYNGPLRDIVFPAALLQAPYFDANADAAVNFGASGATIGHELTHGFDDQGRMLDASGALRDWWTEADDREFKARAAVLGAQYATYEAVPGLHINPDLTMGENLADLGGLAIALDAYHASLHGAPAPVIDGLTGDQRLFRAYAQVWRGKGRDDYIRQLTVSDPHSYRKFRVNGVVRNLDAWYEAFDVQPTDKLYVEPAKRVRIW
jgi:putative endopeptidase